MAERKPSVFAGLDRALTRSTRPQPEATPQEPAASPDQSATQMSSRLTSRSTSRSTSQPTGQSTKQPRSRPGSRIVDRPKAFYITERLDQRLNEAVTYLQTQHGIRKVDRSTVINALLDKDELWSEEALDHLVDQVVSQLTDRLVS